MNKLDAWIIARFESFAHFWQRWTGRDCFWLARACAIASMVMLLLTVLRGVVNWSIDVTAALPAATGYMFIRMCDGIGERERARLSRGDATANPAKISPPMIFARLVCLFMAVSLLFLDGRLIFRVFQVNAVFIWMAEQWLSCDPLPPCVSKIREWLHAHKKKAQAAVA